MKIAKRILIVLLCIIVPLLGVAFVVSMPAIGYYQNKAIDFGDEVATYHGYDYKAVPYEQRKFLYDGDTKIETWRGLASIKVHYYVDEIDSPSFIYAVKESPKRLMTTDTQNMYVPLDWVFDEQIFTIDGTDFAMPFGKCLGPDGGLFAVRPEDCFASFTWRLAETPELYNVGKIAQNGGIYYFCPWDWMEAYQCTEEFLTALNDTGIVDVSGID